MADNYKSKAGTGGRQMQLNLVGLKEGEDTPAVVVTAIGADSKPLYVAEVDQKGFFSLPEEAFKNAHRILIGPKEADAADAGTTVRYRPRQFEELVQRGAVSISPGIWERWRFFVTCVTGTVRLCRRRPWWYYDLLTLAVQPAFKIDAVSTAARSSLTTKESISVLGRAKSLPELIYWPYRCQTICNGTVEVYRRVCCCQPWIIDDPRLPELVRDLEEIVSVIPDLPPIPNPPDPPPYLEQIFLKDGTLDEMAVNANRDLSAIRVLPKRELTEYINARQYLLCRRYSCSVPRLVGHGVINPDGRFNICWRDFPRLLRPFCHEEYAYIVKQTIFGLTFTVYNGVAANIWFRQNDDATLTSYSPLAFSCRDNGEPGSGAYVYLDIIGDTESWNLKTPDATGWDRVAAPAYNDGTVFPSPTPAAAVGANLNRNWGGTLKLNYKFSEDMRNAPVGAKYYRISITEADSSGHPTGARNYLSDGLAWEKSIVTSTGVAIVPVNLGPFPVGEESNLFLIPYDADADWNAGQYHGFLNTNDSRWNDPTKRHLVTLEVFDAAGHRLHPTGTAPTGLLGTATGLPVIETPVPFTFRRRYQDIGDTANVPFAALTHMFWWDNSDLFAQIVNLIKDGLIFNSECLFLGGAPTSTLGIGYRAYHPNEMFQLSHSISWQRGLGSAAGATGTLLGSSSANVGKPPDGPGTSPTNTFAEMLRTDLEPTRKKCAFTVFLTIYSKTTDGDSLGNGGITRTAAFAIDISN
ncbi:MAG TPA: hypothetical protein VGW76_14500 [Pyrinomonadaceae bacterium]|nr:hypothetical protein [Pyrinomonadaceae bacterium]